MLLRLCPGGDCYCSVAISIVVIITNIKTSLALKLESSLTERIATSHFLSRPKDSFKQMGSSLQCGLLNVLWTYH